VTADEGITVTGYGAAGTAPDVVRLSLAAEAADVSVQEAINRASAGLTTLRQALLDGDVAENDVVSTEASAYTEGGARTRHVARFGLVATVRDVARAGELLSAALAAAGDTGRMTGMSFGHSDPSALFAEAQERAMTDARDRATRLAELAGRSLGPVVEVIEGRAGGPPVPIPGPRQMAMAVADFMPVSPGELEVSAVVSVRFAWA
jgi:uncharacterized protein